MSLPLPLVVVVVLAVFAFLSGGGVAFATLDGGGGCRCLFWVLLADTVVFFVRDDGCHSLIWWWCLSFPFLVGGCPCFPLVVPLHSVC